MTAGIIITDLWKRRPSEKCTGKRWRVRVRDPHHHLIRISLRRRLQGR